MKNLNNMTYKNKLRYIKSKSEKYIKTKGKNISFSELLGLYNSIDFCGNACYGCFWDDIGYCMLDDLEDYNKNIKCVCTTLKAINKKLGETK